MMNEKLMFKNRPLLFEVFNFLMEICPHDNDILPGLFAGMTLASIGRDVGISRERVRQKRNRVMSIFKAHIGLTFEPSTGFPREFKTNPDIQLFEIYSMIVKLFRDETSLAYKVFHNTPYDTSTPPLGWVRSSISLPKPSTSARSILIPIKIINEQKIDVHEKKHGMWYTVSHLLSQKRLLSSHKISGFFSPNSVYSTYFLRQIEEIVVEVWTSESSRFFLLESQASRLDKYLALMLRYYSQMSARKAVQRLQTLMESNYPDGDWSLELMEEYVKNLHGILWNEGMIGTSRSAMQTAGFEAVYSSDYVPLTMCETYQKRMADLVQTGNYSISEVIEKVYDGDKYAYSTWFSNTVLDNPLILLEIRETFENIHRYNYHSLTYVRGEE